MTTMHPLNLEIWKHVLHSGTWWSALEIDRHFHLREGESRRRLHDMERNGVIAKRNVAGTRSVKFGVTGGCHVPRGVTLGEVQIHVERASQSESETTPTFDDEELNAPAAPDFRNLTLRQANLIEMGGWRPGDPRQQPPRGSVQKLLDRGLVQVKPVYIGGARVPSYIVPPPVRQAWAQRQSAGAAC